MTGETPVVELKNIWFSYDQGPVLEDVSLSVTKGSFLGIVGPNGSGKTTLLRIILGLLTPQRGRVILFGIDQTQFRDWSRIGYVPQKAPSLNSFPATVREIVLTGRTPIRGFFRFYNRDDTRSVAEALELVGLTSLAHRPITKLSGGQQQRVLLARALAGKPELLILDEPTEGVDSAAQKQFYALLQRLRHEFNLTIIMVSHDIGVVTEQVSHLACLNRRLFFHGPPKEFNLDKLSDVYGHPVTVLTHNH